MQKTAEQHVLARKKLSQSFRQELNGSFSTICDKHVTFPSRQSDNACMQMTPRTISPSKGEAAMLDSHRKNSLGQLCSGRKESFTLQGKYAQFPTQFRPTEDLWDVFCSKAFLCVFPARKNTHTPNASCTNSTVLPTEMRPNEVKYWRLSGRKMIGCSFCNRNNFLNILFNRNKIRVRKILYFYRLSTQL